MEVLLGGIRRIREGLDFAREEADKEYRGRRMKSEVEGLVLQRDFSHLQSVGGDSVPGVELKVLWL